jgi:hypothetical protein
MGTIEDKLRYLAKTKKDIMNALKSKGVEIDESTPFSEYDVMVKSIQGGGDILLCKDMEELEEKGELSPGSLAMVYDAETDTFGGIYEATETGLQVLPTQLTADVANVAPGVKAFGPNGIVEGTFTSDANAESTDLLAPKTAYINGQRVEGAIVPTYDTSLPEQSKISVSYGVTLDDINYKYGVGIRCSSSSSCTVYKVTDKAITSKASIAASQFSATYYTSKAVLAYEPIERDGVKYLRGYVASKRTSDNYVGACTFLINLETFEITNTFWAQGWSSTTSHTPFIKAVPTTSDRIILVRFSCGSANNYTYHVMVKVNWSSAGTTSRTVTTLTTQGNNTSSTSDGFGHFKHQFSDDGLIYCSHSHHVRMWLGGDLYWQLIIKFAPDYSSFTTILNTSQNADETFYYGMLVNKDLYIKQNKLYSINNISGNSIGTAPFTVGRESLGMALGKYFFYAESSTATTLKMYEIGDTTLTLKNTLNIKANQFFFRETQNILYVLESNLLNAYEQGELGTLIAMRRQGVDFYNPYETSDTTAEHILAGKIAYLVPGRTIGAMPNNGALNYYVYENDITIPAGYTSGGTIHAPAFSNFTEYSTCLSITNNILS